MANHSKESERTRMRKKRRKDKSGIHHSLLQTRGIKKEENPNL
jgi:hypothetical protein